MPRGPTVGDDDSDDGGGLGAITSKPMFTVAAVLLGIVLVAGTLTATSGGLLFSGTEVDVQLGQDTVLTSDLRDNGTAVVVSVVDEHGDPVTDGDVTISGDTARLDDPQTAPVGGGTDAWRAAGGDPSQLASNQAAFHLSGEGVEGPTVTLDADQNRGVLEIEVDPPADSDYADEQANPGLIVVDG